MPLTDDPTAGVFSGAPKLEFIDTPEAPNRTVRVLEDFTFTQADDGAVWAAPSGSLVDGASIPRVLWSLVGSPFTGDYVYASIVHDVACHLRTRPWCATHYMFYLACLAGGTHRGRAKLMYLAVRNFGPRWPAPAPAGQVAASLRARVKEELPPSHASQTHYLRRAQAYLAAHGEEVSIEAIDAYASRPQ